jgi:hypothetical protein
VSSEREDLPDDVRERLEAPDAPLEVDLHQDRTKEFKAPGFMRFPTEWDGPYGDVVRGVHDVAESIMLQEFGMAFKVLLDLYDVVREPVVDASTGEIKQDKHGFPVWRRDSQGYPIEDYSRLTIRQREHFMFMISTHLFDWEQKAATMWAEAMFAKGAFEEVFATAFGEDGPGRQTDALRENRARAASAPDRYFGIFKSYLSRRADALVRSLTLINQRLKDTVV